MLQRDPVDNPAELAMGEPGHRLDHHASRLFGIVRIGYGDLRLGKTGHDGDTRPDQISGDELQDKWRELRGRVKRQWGRLRDLDRLIRSEAHIR